MNEVPARLTELDPRQAQVVELRYFAGLSVEETAEVMGIAARTVKEEWAMAKGLIEIAVERGMPNVTPLRWSRIEEVFGKALDTVPPERSQFLESARGEDADLRTEVERLLAGSEEPSWQSPTADLLPAAEFSPRRRHRPSGPDNLYNFDIRCW